MASKLLEGRLHPCTCAVHGPCMQRRGGCSRQRSNQPVNAMCRFMAFDKHMNLVLGDAEEFRKLPPKKGVPDDEVRRARFPSAACRSIARATGARRADAPWCVHLVGGGCVHAQILHAAH
jgi:hypothetical protein